MCLSVSELSSTTSKDHGGRSLGQACVDAMVSHVREAHHVLVGHATRLEEKHMQRAAAKKKDWLRTG